MFSLKNVLSFIHPEGWKFALISLFISTFFFFIWLPIAILGCLITLFIIWFFRDATEVIILWDPERESKLSYV